MSNKFLHAGCLKLFLALRPTARHPVLLDIGCGQLRICDASQGIEFLIVSSGGFIFTLNPEP